MIDKRAVNRQGNASGADVPHIRLTGLLVANGCLLLVRQVLRECAHWNLPGGGLEPGETLAQGLEREMREECGLAVEAGDLLYVTDRFKALGHHVVDMAFEVRLAASERRELHAGSIGPFPVSGTSDDRLADVRMVPFDQLTGYGFSQKFADLVAGGFPGRGSYMGDFHQFYGSTPKALRNAV